MDDALLLARWQFAVNITFHILFPTLSIGLGWWLLYFRWQWVRHRQTVWLAAYRFWTKIFALTFALGVVSGITMSFQFGTNWPGFMERTGNISGPLLGYEVLTAFFMEATFLGVMLFGHDRVSERTHLCATALVSVGTTLSAFWILSLNSWMQTPAGYTLINGEFHVASWWAIVFNPSFPYRLTHVLLASALTSSFVLIGICAYRILAGQPQDAMPRVMKNALLAAAVLMPLQALVGDLHGLNTLRHQPQKIAAIEGVWHTERGAPLVLWSWPDEATQTHHGAVSIPRMASLILTHQLDGEIRGLNEFEGSSPPVKPLFFGFRLMVGLGLLMGLVSWVGWWQLRKARWQAHQLPRWGLRVLSAMTYSGWLASLAGWYVTEIGRQPYLVHGLLKTADLASATPSTHIALTLSAYVLIYGLLIAAYIGVLRHLARQPIDATAPLRDKTTATQHPGACP